MHHTPPLRPALPELPRSLRRTTALMSLILLPLPAFAQDQPPEDVIVLPELVLQALPYTGEI